MPSTRSQRGQGTVEYVAIIALVALVLAAAVAGAAGLGPGIGNAVVGQVRHALCIVAGRACEEQVAERPCVVRTARDERRESVSLGFVQLGAGRVVLRERLSDGTLRLTVLHRGRAGVTAGFGSSTRVRVGGVEVDVGAHAQGTVAGLVGGGQVFEVRTAAEADAIVRRLRAEGSPTLDAVRRLVRRGGKAPAADATLAEGGFDAGVDFELSAGEAKAGASGGGENVLGRRVDRRTGETTWYLRLDRELPVFADAMLGDASGELDGDALLSVTMDRRGPSHGAGRARRRACAGGRVGADRRERRRRHVAVGGRGARRPRRSRGRGRAARVAQLAGVGRGGPRPWAGRCATAPGSTSGATRGKRPPTATASTPDGGAARAWNGAATGRRRACSAR